MRYNPALLFSLRGKISLSTSVTVQRWEKELGLPIRRPNHTSKSTVLAVITEVNDWVRSHQLSDGREDENELDRSVLLEHIEALQAEVFELRRQLQVACAKTA
jgi:hypothetical protein